MWKLSVGGETGAVGAEEPVLDLSYYISILQETLMIQTDDKWIRYKTGTNEKDKDLIHNLQAAGNMMSSKSVMYTLLHNIPNKTFNDIFASVGARLEHTILYCNNAGSKCNNIKRMHTSLFPVCFQYNMLDSRPGPKVSDEGLSNGVSMVLATSVGFASKVLESLDINQIETSSFSIFNSSYLPLSANGIRLTITSPGVQPSIDDEGFDISPGQSTLISITGKEIIRQPAPFSDCSTTDYELNKLQESVNNHLGYIGGSSSEDEGTTYTQKACRSACLQNFIWSQCHCLYLEARLPYHDVDGSLLCGALTPTEMENFFRIPDLEFDAVNCVQDANALISETCKFIHPLINDLACVYKAKEEFIRDKNDGKLNCQCPPACYSYDYDISVSQTPWPSDGYEMLAAYQNLVKNQVWNYAFEDEQTGPITCRYDQSGLDVDGQSGSGLSQNGSGDMDYSDDVGETHGQTGTGGSQNGSGDHHYSDNVEGTQGESGTAGNQNGSGDHHYSNNVEETHGQTGSGGSQNWSGDQDYSGDAGDTHGQSGTEGSQKGSGDADYSGDVGEAHGQTGTKGNKNGDYSNYDGEAHGQSGNGGSQNGDYSDYVGETRRKRGTHGPSGSGGSMGESGDEDYSGDVGEILGALGESDDGLHDSCGPNYINEGIPNLWYVLIL